VRTAHRRCVTQDQIEPGNGVEGVVCDVVGALISQVNIADVMKVIPAG